jgi:hypothetical protein
MPVAGQSVHVVLKDRSSNNVTPLRLLRDENGSLLYSWVLAPALAPDVAPQDVSYGEFRPEQELPWSQDDWSDGGLQHSYSPRDPNRYALADGVWAATPNELSIGSALREVTFGVRNGATQLKATTNWSVSGITLTAVTTAPHSGEYHFQGIDWSTSDYAQVSLVQAEQLAADMQSKVIVVSAVVRGSAAGGQVRLQIVESGGSATPTTNGSAVTLTTSYQLITVTVTLQSDSTAVNIRVEMSADGGADRTVFFDTVNAYFGTAIPNASNTTMKVQNQSAVAELLACTDRALWKFNQTSGYWALQNVFGAAITGFEIYDDIIFIGQGESTDYQYSDAGSSLTFNVISGSSRANRFAKTLNVNGNWALAKSLNDDEIFLNTTPTNGTTWGAAVEVGKDDHPITQLFQLDGSLGVGKGDGFYSYRALTGNRFTNDYPGAESMVDSGNFDRGILYNGLFFTTLGETGFVVWNGQTWTNLAEIIRPPGFSDFGERPRAFGTDGRWLYILVQDLAADSITKTCWLLMMEQKLSGGWVVHPYKSLVMSDGLDIFTFKPNGESNRHLYINGDINNEAMCYRMQLPDQSSTPRLGTNRDLALSATIITSWMNWNRPAVRKSLNRLTAFAEIISGVLTVTSAYELDDETSFTNINSDQSVFTSQPSQTIGLNEGVSAKRVRFQHTFTTNANTSSPVVKAFDLASNWRPPRLRQWSFIATLEEDVRGIEGVPLILSPARIQVQLDALQKEDSPLQFADIDGTDHRGHITGLRELQVRTANQGGNWAYTRGLEIQLVESPSLSGFILNVDRLDEVSLG